MAKMSQMVAAGRVITVLAVLAVLAAVQIMGVMAQNGQPQDQVVAEPVTTTLTFKVMVGTMAVVQALEPTT
jgi:hypothetical protein